MVPLFLRFATLLLCAVGTPLAASAGEPLPKPRPEARPERWLLTLYGGPVTTARTSDIFLEGTFRFQSGSLGTVALRREVVDLTDALVFVLEGQLAQHFRGSRHQELNGTYGLTWRWRGPVRGAATVLHGLSWATSDPRFPADSSPPQEPVRLLSFLGAEIALELPARPDTALVLRYHHRSGAFGLLEGGHDEYTMVGAGFQVRF